MIPKDPVMLLSYVNTQLRDYYESLEALCTCRGMKNRSWWRSWLLLITTTIQSRISLCEKQEYN